MKHLTQLLALTLACLFGGFTHATETAPFVWLEAEKPDAMPAAAGTAAWGKAELISGELLNIQFSKKDIAKAPNEISVRYTFDAPEAGTYDFWGRFAFTIRNPFEWRLNGGAWQSNSEDTAPITNTQELAFWNPIGWSPMAEAATLKAKGNVLEFRLDPRAGDREDFRFIADAFVFQQGGFQPNFRYAPGDHSWKDDAAASHSFALPAKGSSATRQEIALDGHWQYAPYDERIAYEETRTLGAAIYPDLTKVNWYGMEIPQDRNRAFSSHRWSHRFLLRSQVDVPRLYDGRSFFLRFEALSLINTLFINGERVDDFDVHYGQWHVDVSDYLKPGERNEILLVVKDPWYALGHGQGNEPGKLANLSYVPWDLWNQNQGVTMKLEWPVKGSDKTGIIDSVFLVATQGDAYVDDVFVKPFPVTRGEIEVDVTLGNTGESAAKASYSVGLSKAGESGMVGPTRTGSVTVPAGETVTKTLTFPAAGIEQWWPDSPVLYHAVTTLEVDGKPSDRLATRFGNRQWEVRGDQFYLNGVRQHLRADLTHYGVRPGTDLDRVLADWERQGQNMMRRRFQYSWGGMTPREVLGWADENGVNVRQNAGTFDGQHASYALAWRDKDRKKHPNEPLYENWRAQMLNGVKARWNHPSVMIWELDNEIVYINGRNFGNLDIVEPEFVKTSDQIMEMDPTRVTVTGGGAAGMEQKLPVYGVHYFETSDRHYPDEAYTLEKSVARYKNDEGGKVWPLDLGSRPIFMSETAFLPGRNGSQFAAVAGERAFLGKAQNPQAFALLHEMYSTGYRWAEVGAVHHWMGNNTLPKNYHYHFWQPIAPLMREWDRSFVSGQEITRTFKLFNDTKVERKITVAGSLVGSGGSAKPVFTTTQTVGAGGDVLFTETFALPKAKAPADYTFIVTATTDGEEVYRHSYAYRVLPASGIDRARVGSRGITVWDPSGAVQQRLRAQRVAFSEIDSADGLNDDLDMLIVGPNAISEDLATSNRWMQLLAAGVRFLVLEQEHPLHFQATPANMQPAGYDGRISFSQNLEHPVFAGLKQHDLSFWNSDHVVYRNIYTKPTRGAVSLAHADNQLAYSALLFAPLNDTGMLLSQYAVGEKLGSNVVAQTLFDNMVDYLASYAPTVRPVTVVAPEGGPIDELLGEISLQYSRASDTVAAIKSGKPGILIVEGTADNLTTLAANPRALEAYFAKGGWVKVMGVTPESLDAFNELVGYDHLIRPFEMERTMFPAVRDPLTAGLTLRDVVMGSGERIQRWNRDEWPAEDAFSYILDIDDIAPFAEFPKGRSGPRSDGYPRNMINGFTGGDHWRMTYTMGATDRFTLDLPRKERVTGVMIDPTSIFNQPTTVELIFDGDQSTAVTIEMDGSDSAQSFEIDPVAAKQVTINLKAFNRTDQRDLVSIDNIEITVARPDDFAERVKPLLNIGGLIRYPRGEGGILVNQYRIAGTESNPENLAKKKTVVATLLRNLGAKFSGASLIIAGANVRYEPISLEAYGNLYLQQAQGFPQRTDLSTLPLGERTFADVRYDIRDFETSPLESAVTLKHPKLRSNADRDTVTIAVGRKADALFFLHTFIWEHHRDWSPNRREPEPPIVFEYVVTYADGTTAVLPIQYKDGVEHYLRENPKALPNAAVAWQDTVDGKDVAVYQYQWNNPDAGKVIESVTLRYNKEEGSNRGLPILLGITAAESAQD